MSLQKLAFESIGQAAQPKPSAAQFSSRLEGRTFQFINLDNAYSWAGVGAAFVISAIFGAAMARTVSQNGIAENQTEKSWERIEKYQVGIIVIYLTAISVLSDFVQPTIVPALFGSLTAGLLLGVYCYAYCQSNNELFIDHAIDHMTKANIYYSHQQHLHLSDQNAFYLKFLDPSKFWQKIQSKIGPVSSLTLDIENLADGDLKKLKEGGWFDRIQKLKVQSANPPTPAKLVALGKNVTKVLEHLDLSDLQLEDAHLESMAKSGYFSRVTSLKLSNNPRITGEGLAWIGKGFTNLKLLDVSGNPNIIGKNLDQWIASKEFKKLEILNLNNTNLSEAVLQSFIEKAEWFQDIQEVTTFDNPLLKQTPPSIALLKQYGKQCDYIAQQMFDQNKDYLEVFSKFPLNNYSIHLRYVDPAALFKAVSKHKNFEHLVITDATLTDEDLQRLARGGWFQELKSILIEKNTKISAVGLSEIRSEGNLQLLVLSETNISDDDLKQVADSKNFKTIQSLVLERSPRITEKGVMSIASEGFKGLEFLDLSYNSQLVGINKDAWIKENRFSNLKSIGLKGCNVTTDDLSRWIEESEWFRNLEGLLLTENNSLSFKDNILKMSRLETCREGRRCYINYFQGSGLYFTLSNSNHTSNEIKSLMVSKKARPLLTTMFINAY